MADVLVVGGGVAGLAAAHEARRRGHSVTVLEAEARPGGVLHSERLGGYLCEQAANGFLDNASGGAIDLCRALGVELAPARPAAKLRWLWRKGALQPLPMSPPAILRSGLLSARGKLRLLYEPLVRSRSSGDESLGSFIRRRMGAEVAEVFAQALVTGIWAGDAERLSAAAAFPRLVDLEARHGSLFKGALAARKGAQRKADGEGMTMLAPVEGVSALIDALRRGLGDAVRVGARARVLEKGGPGFRVRLEAGDVVEGARVILACPPPAAAELVAPHDGVLAEILGDVPYVGVAVVHVGIDAGRLGHPLDGFGFLTCPGEELRCLGIVFESTIWPGRAPEGCALLRLIYGGARDPVAPSLSDEVLREAALRDVGRALGLAGAPSFVRVVRHARAIPQYVVGHMARVAEMERRAALLGVILAGSGYHGVAVNDCVKDAARVADLLGKP